MPKASLAQVPFAPPKWDIADVDAVQAVLRGEADENQQRRAMAWIIRAASAPHEFHYYQNERDTAFALGRAFVGQQIEKLASLNISSLRRAENASQK